MRGLCACLAAAVSLLIPAAAGVESTLALEYQRAWYLENGLQEVARAARLYASIAGNASADPALAARALLRLAACYRHLGKDDAASETELEARRRFPDAIKKFPAYRLEQLHRRLDEGFDVGETATAGRAIEKFLKGLDVATVHSVCEAFYNQARELRRAKRPEASIAALRKAIAISTYLRQLERSAFLQKDIGDICASAGRYAEAIAAYRRAQADFPSYKNVGAWAQLSIAEVYRLRDKLPEAVEAYRAVARGYPGQVGQVLWAKLWMGDAFRVAGKMADARAAWRRVVEEFNEPEYAQQVVMAALLLGQATPPRRDPFPRDEFANDRAYFVAVHYEMSGQQEQAAAYYRTCRTLSRENDWPRELAERAVEAARPTAEP